MTDRIDNTYNCTDCGKLLQSYDEVCYDGPVDSQHFFECSPHTLTHDWAILCCSCTARLFADAEEDL